MQNGRFWLLASVGVLCLLQPAATRAEPDSYADLVARVLPSVVNISIEGKGQRIKIEGVGGAPSYADYMVEYVGAGSITHSSGIIVTNRHVVKNAYEITVTLQDGNAYKAQLLGEGVGNDLAMLKIDAGRPLPTVKVGNSDEVRVGDHVLAIGNPLGLRGSVSAGIVSGLHRHIESGIAMQDRLGEFIQTDAAINHGNSGGPLFNMKGEVIGVDNQIFSDFKGGGNVGLGFAIPSNDVQFMLQQVLQYGKPRLGWVGLHLTTVTPRMAAAIGLATEEGAIISEVTPGSPAAEAGLQVGDVVQSIGNERVTDSRTVARAAIDSLDKTLQLHVWRNGKALVFPVTVKEYEQQTWMSYKNEKVTGVVFAKISDSGMVVADLTDELRTRFNLDAKTIGPVLTEVVGNTAASGAGLEPGDVILKIQFEDVHSLSQMAERLKALSNKGQRDALFLVERNGTANWLTLPLRL
jgi:serine protease Do